MEDKLLKDNFSYFSMKAYLVTPYQNHPNETVIIMVLNYALMRNMDNNPEIILATPSFLEYWLS